MWAGVEVGCSFEAEQECRLRTGGQFQAVNIRCGVRKSVVAKAPINILHRSPASWFACLLTCRAPHRLEEGLKAILADSFTLYEYPPGSTLYHRGWVCSEAHVLMSGEMGQVEGNVLCGCAPGQEVQVGAGTHWGWTVNVLCM